MKSVRDWDEEFVLGLPLGEFDWFEVKGRRALDLTLSNVKEREVFQSLSKAVSAFANSGGGTLVYGLKNPDTDQGRWEVDDGGIDTSIKSDTREWLETVIPNAVDFPLTKFNVYQILPSDHNSQIQSGRALYLIDIPDSTGAPHQATDNKYYIRVAGRSRPVGHRLVVDIMNRRQHPKVELNFQIEVTGESYHDPVALKPKFKNPSYTLNIGAKNAGRVYARYVNAFIKIPVEIASEDIFKDREIIEDNGEKYYEFYKENTIRDVVDIGGSPPYSYNKYGPSRFDPILPGLSHIWSIDLADDFESKELDGLTIKWETYADNAPRNRGETLVKDLEITERWNT